MPITLALHLYHAYVNSVKQSFDKNNKVLSFEDIQSIRENTDRSKAIELFHSALIDHHPVDGIPYYLNYPISGLFYHDGHKMALIVYVLGEFISDCSERERQSIRTLLDQFLFPEKNPGYVQVLAWSVLADAFGGSVDVFRRRYGLLQKSLSGSTAQLSGVLVCLEHLVRTSHVMFVSDLLNREINSVKYCIQKIMVAFFLRRNERYFAVAGFSESLNEWLRQLKSEQELNSNFSRKDFLHGCREIELLSSAQQATLWAGTSQAYIADLISKYARVYVQAAGLAVQAHF